MVVVDLDGRTTQRDAGSTQRHPIVRLHEEDPDTLDTVHTAIGTARQLVGATPA